MKTITSKRFRINLLDLGKGFIVAAITAIVAGCGQIFEQWIISSSFSIEKVQLMYIIKIGVGGGVAYLIKQFFTPAKIIMKGDDITNEIIDKLNENKKND